MDRNINQSTMSWDLRHLVDSARNDFLVALSESKDSRIESFLLQIPESARQMLLADLIAIEIQFRREQGENPAAHEYIDRFPNEADWLKRHFASLLDSSEVPQSTRIAPLVRGTGEAAPAELKTQILDRYQPMECLGRGGFGEVWSARDSLLDRMVAIKQLRVDRQFPNHQSQMLLKEGQRLAQLDHHNIVRVLDAGVANDQFYLVSELMPGGTLEEWLQTHTASFELATRWMVALAHALHHAHSRNIVHRDIKPSNILFGVDGDPRLADFGLAVSEEELAGESPQAVGSIYYMPPEQARGESHLADPRSDVYSLGMVFYRLLTGRLPYSAKTTSDYRREILTREPRPLRAINSEIPLPLESLCLKCLNKSINQRPTTALEVAEQLETWLKPSTPLKPPNSHKWLVAGVIITAVIVFAIVAIRPKSQPAPVGGQPVLPDAFRNQRPAFADPEVIAWSPRKEDDLHLYDENTKSYRFEAFSEALFQVEKRAKPQMVISLDYTSDNWLGQGGIFWGLHTLPDGTQRCRCVLLGRYGHEDLAQLRILSLMIGPSSGGRRSVFSRELVAHQDLPLLAGSRASLRLAVNANSVEQIWLNEDPILLAPAQYPDDGLTTSKSLGVGFAGHLGDFSVYKFSVE